MTRNSAGVPQHTTATAHLTTFEMCFSSTPRGARLARRLAAVRLEAWGFPYGSEPHDDIVLIVAELSANAVRHGRVPGRDFRLRLCAAPGSGTVRVEVTDTRGERVPKRPAAPDAAGAEESGRGLVLVARLAARWDWHPRPDGPGKTVWAEYALPGGPCPAPVGGGPAADRSAGRVPGPDEAEVEGTEGSVSLEETIALLRAQQG